MSSRKPSERRNFREADMEINLTPLMNLIAILIPTLLISVAFIEITALDVEAASSQPSRDEPPAPSLELSVTLTTQGYTVTTRAGALGADGDAAPSAGVGPTVPLVLRQVSCELYLGTRPPPRERNRERPACTDPAASQEFLVFDTVELKRRLVDLKATHPDERAIILGAEPDIHYEALTDAMDASREFEPTPGRRAALFDRVQLRPYAVPTPL